MKSTPENKVKKKLKKLLSGYVFSVSDRYHSGLPDIMSVFEGHFHAYECKARGQKPTKIQLNVLRGIARHGGRAYVVTMDEEEVLAFEQITA